MNSKPVDEVFVAEYVRYTCCRSLNHVPTILKSHKIVDNPTTTNHHLVPVTMLIIEYSNGMRESKFVRDAHLTRHKRKLVHALMGVHIPNEAVTYAMYSRDWFGLRTIGCDAITIPRDLLVSRVITYSAAER